MLPRRKRHNVVVKKDKAGEWRWTAHNPENNEPVADSAEGYENLGHCKRMAKETIRGARVTVSR